MSNVNILRKHVGSIWEDFAESDARTCQSCSERNQRRPNGASLNLSPDSSFPFFLCKVCVSRLWTLAGLRFATRRLRCGIYEDLKVWSFCRHADKNGCIEDAIKSINLETFSPRLQRKSSPVGRNVLVVGHVPQQFCWSAICLGHRHGLFIKLLPSS